MGLLEAPQKKATKADVLAAIRSMHVLQIDTISMVARSPYLVLFSRLGHYDPNWLDELLAEGKLFEYWAHAACFLPIDDYPLYRTQQLALERYGFKRAPERLDRDALGHLLLLDRIREEGAVRATDFEHDGGRKGNGWWDWKPDKLRLETLFTAGELMVARRENFHRIYDLRERVLPKRFLNDSVALTHAALVRELSLRAVKAMGVVQARWIGDYFRHAAKTPQPHPDVLVDEAELIRVKVDGWKHPGYVHRDHRHLLRRAERNELRANHTALLSPFDPLVWDRERALASWDFDYRLECYTPAEKRKYGYFTLPVLVKGSLMGRANAKAHRSHKVFELKTLYLEASSRLNKDLDKEADTQSLADALASTARWHGATTLTIGRIVGSKLTRESERSLRSALLVQANRQLTKLAEAERPRA
ncbi:MAG: winged helix-turn-helix domain-containing protein [Burkholderiales bacterium]|nr:MAG: winged helix-turn-helix domain-containing protein [Burkholderiales bacterium]